MLNGEAAGCLDAGRSCLAPLACSAIRAPHAWTSMKDGENRVEAKESWDQDRSM